MQVRHFAGTLSEHIRPVWFIVTSKSTTSV